MTFLSPPYPWPWIDRRSGRRELRPLGVGRGPRNGFLGSVQCTLIPASQHHDMQVGRGLGVPFPAQWGNALLEQLGLTFSSTSSSVRNGEGQLWVFPSSDGPWGLIGRTSAHTVPFSFRRKQVLENHLPSPSVACPQTSPHPEAGEPPSRPWPPGSGRDCPPSDPGLSCPSRSESPLLPLALCPSGWVLGHPGCCAPAGWAGWRPRHSPARAPAVIISSSSASSAGPDGPMADLGLLPPGTSQAGPGLRMLAGSTRRGARRQISALR